MRKPIFFFAGAGALFLVACLVAPDEPNGTTSNALSCAAGERAFNGSCRKVCTSSSTCPSGTACMNVGAGVALCLDYKHCAYLSSDTKCGGASPGYYSSAYYDETNYGGYGGYGYGYGWESYDFGYGAYGYPSSSSTFYGYGGAASAAGCAGDATWLAIEPNASAPIRCGDEHTVTRCAPVAPGQCGLVSGTTVDVADP